MKKSQETTRYAQMGMAALLPGMTYMLELMTKAVAEHRDLLSFMQDAGQIVAKGRNGWPDDPEERSAEMKRRMAVAKENKRLTPEGLANLRKIRRRSWKNKTPEERAAWQAKMAAGKAKARRAKRKAERDAVSPVVRLEKTA
jgi:hypothetical protein